MELEKIYEDVAELEYTVHESDLKQTTLKHEGQSENAEQLQVIPDGEGEEEENGDSTPISEMKKGDKFYGTITTNKEGKNVKLTDFWTILKAAIGDKAGDYKTLTVMNNKGESYKTNAFTAMKDNIKEKMKELKERQEAAAKKKEEERIAKEKEALLFNYSHLQPEVKLTTLIKSGINNIWMVGPAGCGKSTMGRNVATEMNLPYLVISCGIGTSAAEFVGYKYPTREATKFAQMYSEPSIILIDEITALDPAVAQVLNAALANDEIETTTGLVKRHPECIIIATSNTFGTGASRQYVANNQLDASTIDRFVGGVVEVDYSTEFESKFDSVVVEYVNFLRRVIKGNDIRRVASTRMIITGAKLKNAMIRDWQELLITNWTKAEKELVKQTKEKEATGKPAGLNMLTSKSFPDLELN